VRGVFDLGLRIEPRERESKKRKWISERGRGRSGGGSYLDEGGSGHRAPRARRWLVDGTASASYFDTTGHGEGERRGGWE
jgi:hypothetical protein